MHTWLLRLLLALSLSQCALAEDPIIKLELRHAVNAKSGSITLDEIASIEVRGMAPALLERLKQSVIDFEFQPGGIKFLSSEDIQLWFRRTHPDLQKYLRVEGASFVRVDLVGQLLSGSSYAKIGRDCLHKWLEGRYESFTIREAESARDITLPNGELVVFAPRCEFDLDRRITVLIEIRVADRLYQTVPVTYEVDVTGTVLVATIKIEGLASVNLDRFEKQQRNIASVQSAPVTGVDQTRNKRLRRTIYPGQVLTLALLEPVPDVVKGSAVTVIARVGGVTVSQGAVAMEDGAISEDVEVENVGSKSRFMAKIIGKGRLIAQ
jgi:flagella basal body P-ring formation protein FlgA